MMKMVKVNQEIGVMEYDLEGMAISDRLMMPEDLIRKIIIQVCMREII